jgi:DnaJ-class molecular chaperone
MSNPLTEVADCPMCEGAGGFPRTEMECCGAPAFDGSCCGMGKPVARLDQCEYCGGSGKLPILGEEILNG